MRAVVVAEKQGVNGLSAVTTRRNLFSSPTPFNSCKAAKLFGKTAFKINIRLFEGIARIHHQWASRRFLGCSYHLKFTSRQLKFLPFRLGAAKKWVAHLLEPLNDVVISSFNTPCPKVNFCPKMIKSIRMYSFKKTYFRIENEKKYGQKIGV